MMKDIVSIVTGWNITDILKSASLSIHERYFHGNSEAYGNLQNEEYPLEDPTISYFMGDA